MRARRRRNASDYFSAALLELSVMGIFVLIAQPQLREAIIELVHPSLAAIDGHASNSADQALVRKDVQTADQTSASGPRRLQLEDSPTFGLAQALGPRINKAALSMRTAGYAPLEHFESFAVPVPGNGVQATQTQSVSDVAQHVARYAPNQTPTQLTAGDWHIAAAAQSPRPLTGWTPARPADAGYRDTYPPPFGTQSQWK